MFHRGEAVRKETEMIPKNKGLTVEAQLRGNVRIRAAQVTAEGSGDICNSAETVPWNKRHRKLRYKTKSYYTYRTLQ
jgi:hypothetical protein